MINTNGWNTSAGIVSQRMLAIAFAVDILTTRSLKTKTNLKKTKFKQEFKGS